MSQRGDTQAMAVGWMLPRYPTYTSTPAIRGDRPVPGRAPADPRVTSRTRGPCRPKRASSELRPQIEARLAYGAVCPNKQLAGYLGRCQHPYWAGTRQRGHVHNARGARPRKRVPPNGKRVYTTRRDNGRFEAHAPVQLGTSDKGKRSAREVGQFCIVDEFGRVCVVGIVVVAIHVVQ